jgi:peptidoglycan/LPS O-acetylase OafA/YrhL
MTNGAIGIFQGGATKLTPSATAQTTAAASAGRRNAGLDALRAALTLLVLVHHAAITYGAAGAWYYHEVQPDRTLQTTLLSLFTAINQAYFMGLFFLIAGYFTPGAVTRSGAWVYLRERALRLGVPLLVYLFLISPFTIALALIAQGRPFLPTLINSWRLGYYENGPLWFAEALLIFTLAYLAWRALALLLRPARLSSAPVAFPSNLALAAAALGVGAAAFALRLVWPVGVQAFGLQLGFFAGYVVLFAAGCAGASLGRLDAATDAQRRLWGIVAWLALPVLPVVVVLGCHIPGLQGDLTGGWNIQAAVYAFWEPFLAWGAILALLHAFERRFVGLGPTGSALARRAYAIYVIHPPVLVAIALAWDGVAAPHLVKFAITGAATCLACFWLAGLVLRAPWIRRIV